MTPSDEHKEVLDSEGTRILSNDKENTTTNSDECIVKRTVERKGRLYRDLFFSLERTILCTYQVSEKRLQFSPHSWNVFDKSINRKSDLHPTCGFYVKG